MRKDLIIAVLMTFCLTTALFMIIPISSSPTVGKYDPWLDYNDDGAINFLDAILLGASFGTTGTPINKTQLLLEILAKIDSLNTTLQDLRAYVETRIPKKGKIIISPALFQPKDNTQAYYKRADYLRGDGLFDAFLQLPNGAIITNVTAKVVDGVTDGYVGVSLRRFTLDGFLQEMAWMQTTLEAQPWDVILYDDTIQYAEIDNQNYIYALTVGFSYNTVYLNLRWVIIEYEYQ